MEYTVDYFIKKFEAIPENKWFIGGYEDGYKKCALGHCRNVFNLSQNEKTYGHMYGAEFKSIIDVFGDLVSSMYGIGFINDGLDKRYQQPTPKQRILAALYDIKKMQSNDAVSDVVNEAVKVKEIIRYVAVPETISESIPETIFN